MKQLIQSFKTRGLELFDIHTPICRKNKTLVETTVSLVVVDKIKKERVRNTLENVFTKLDSPIPLGESLSGINILYLKKPIVATRCISFMNELIDDYITLSKVISNYKKIDIKRVENKKKDKSLEINSLLIDLKRI